MVEKHKTKLIVMVSILSMVLLLFYSVQGNRSTILQEENATNLNDVVLEDPPETVIQPSEEVITKVYVDIKGAIKEPGVYTLQSDQRVDDAIKLAGGFSNEANTNSVNLAEKVVDEMVIYVASVNEEISEVINQIPSNSTKNDKININQASSEELQELPRIGPSKAHSIIEYRETNGFFKSIDELLGVSGIGEKTFEQLEDLITVQ